MNIHNKQVGLTKDVGWQFGLSKTFPYPQRYLWDFMFSDGGLALWLGELQDDLEEKGPYKTHDDTEGFVRVFNQYSHIRIDWRRKGWENVSRLQVRVIGNEEKATISFHQEKLSDSDQREEMKLYWNEKMNAIEKALNQSAK